MEGDEEHQVALACAICGALFCVLSPLSFWILWSVNWRAWRIYSWIYARKWPDIIQGRQLSVISSLLSLIAWAIVLSPIVLLITWGGIIIGLLRRNIIGLAVRMAGMALLLAFYSIMLWWRTQSQSLRGAAYLLSLAVALLSAYELCAVYVTAGVSASELIAIYNALAKPCKPTRQTFILRIAYLYPNSVYTKWRHKNCSTYW